MDNPLVSIIVPCYNQSKYIRETLNSIIYQTYKNWECIIVNDGSTDNSESVIFQTIKEDNRFKYIKTPNLGVVSARNTSIRNSSGIYIFPLDSDDTIHPNCIEYCINEFLNAPGTILVCPQAEFFF